MLLKSNERKILWLLDDIDDQIEKVADIQGHEMERRDSWKENTKRLLITQKINELKQLDQAIMALAKSKNILRGLIREERWASGDIAGVGPEESVHD